MRRNKLPKLLVIPFLLLVSTLLLASVQNSPRGIARAKSAAVPLAQALTPDHQRARDIALADPRVQSHTLGRRTEVFGVARFLDLDTPVTARGCTIENCRVVSIFDFDASATFCPSLLPLEDCTVTITYVPQSLGPHSSTFSFTGFPLTYTFVGEGRPPFGVDAP